MQSDIDAIIFSACGSAEASRKEPARDGVDSGGGGARGRGVHDQGRRLHYTAVETNMGMDEGNVFPKMIKLDVGGKLGETTRSILPAKLARGGPAGQKPLLEVDQEHGRFAT
ncbi:hypothetical protein ACFYY2_34695 [Streptomyces sp. NPDC001822]|uniref:hypothetical protein n=1 Tax=Streptomyces sp. NPDC001822 TaxID=3364614 RepID=UPI00368BD1EE